MTAIERTTTTDWTFHPQERYWQYQADDWKAQVGRWPSSLEYTALVIAPTILLHAPHVFRDRESAQAWCLRMIMTPTARSILAPFDQPIL